MNSENGLLMCFYRRLLFITLGDNSERVSVAAAVDNLSPTMTLQLHSNGVHYGL